MKKGLKRITVIAVLFALLVGLVGCSSTGATTTANSTTTAGSTTAGSGSETSSSASGEKYTIGFVSATFSDDYCKRLADAFVACSDNYTDVEVKALNGNGDVAQIISAVETFKTQGVDALIVQAIGNVPDACAWCNEQDVPLVFVNIKPQLSDSIKDLKYYYVGSSEEKIGAQEAEALAAGLDQGAKVCLLMLPLGQDNQVYRTKGFEDWFAKNRPDVKIIDKQAGQSTDTAQAISISEDWIQRFGIDGIDAIADQTNMATIGLIQVLKSHDAVGKIKIAGIGCPPVDGFNWVADGSVYCDLYQNPMSEAAAAVDAAYKMIKGQEDQIEADENNVVWVDMTTVNKDNVEEVRATAKY